MTCGSAREAIEARIEARQRGGIDEDVFEKFADSLSYVQGDYMDKATYERLKKALSPASTRSFTLRSRPRCSPE